MERLSGLVARRRGGAESLAALTPRARAYALALICLALYGFGAIYIRNLPQNHDIGWLLYAAGEVLGGAELYVDIVESNPPLVMFFMVGVKALATLTGTRDLAVFHALVLTLVAASLLLGYAVLRRTLAAAGPVAVIILVSIYLLISGVGYHFGQREHLTAVFVLPYLYAAAARVKGVDVPKGLAIAIGIFAGLGFAMKPFFLTVWLGVEAYVALKGRIALLKRPEQFAIIGVGVAYGLAALLFAPAYIPLARWAMTVYHGWHSWGPRAIILHGNTVFMLLVLIAHSNVPSSRALNDLRRIFAIATVMFFLAIVLQNKGWDYHWIHLKTTASLLLAMVAVDAVRKLGSERAWPILQRSTVVVTAVAMSVLTALAHRSVRDEWAELATSPWYLYDMMNLVEEHAPGGTISSLTTTMQVGFPLVNFTGVKWGSRFNCLWLLPGLYLDVERGDGAYPYRAPEERGELEQYLVEAVITDLQESQPDLLIIDLAPPGRHMVGFDYIEYLSIDDRFRQLFQEYDHVTRVGPYQIYKRLRRES